MEAARRAMRGLLALRWPFGAVEQKFQHVAPPATMAGEFEDGPARQRHYQLMRARLSKMRNQEPGAGR